MKQNKSRVWNNILMIFGNKFIKYNVTIVVLILPLTLLATATKQHLFVLAQVIDLLLMMTNAVYILGKVVINRKEIWK